MHSTYQVYFFPYPVPPCGIQNHYSFSAGILAMQIHLLVCHLPRYLMCNLCVFLLSTTCWRLALTCGPTFNIARFLVHAISQLPGLTCPLLDRTPSIKGGTIDVMDISGDIKSSLFHTQHYSWLAPLWVEVGLHNTFLVRRHQILGIQIYKVVNLASLHFFQSPKLLRRVLQKKVTASLACPSAAGA